MAAEAAFLALQQRLSQSEGHTQQLSEALDALRRDSQNAVSGLEAQLAQSRAELRQQVEAARVEMHQQHRHREPERQWSLAVPKNHEPKTFSGGNNEDYKAWAKKMKKYCNAIKDGMSKLLEWAEIQKEPIKNDDQEVTEWEHGVAANTKLHDYLGLVTTGDALRIVEAHEGQGLEA